MTVFEFAALTLGFTWTVLLPGFAVLAWARRPQSPLLWVYALGLGFALVPLLFLFATHVGLPVSRVTLAIFGLAGAGALVLGARRSRWVDSSAQPDRTRSRWGIAFVALFVAILALRVLPLRGIEVLPGTDAYQHAMVARLFVESGGIPDDYHPFAPLESFTYHFGVHANAAALTLATGVEEQKTLMFLEVLLMAFAALAGSRLALALTGDRRLALVAGAIGGLASTFPAYLVNWARLPQLAGAALVTLIVADLATSSDRERPEWWTTAVLVAGLLVTHYRMALVLGYSLLALCAWALTSNEPRERLVNVVRRAGVAIGAGIALASPWIVHILGAGVGPGARPQGTPSIFFFSWYRIDRIAEVPATWIVVALAVVGAAVGLARRRPEVTFLLSWVALLLAFSNPYALPLPAAGLADFVTVVSSILFCPLAILGAYAVTSLVPGDAARLRMRRGHVAALVAVLVFGAYTTRDLLGDPWIYAYPEDVEAFEWIEDNVPEDAVFVSRMYVNSNGLVEVVDAGGWITYFTGRRQLAPPLLFLNEEHSPQHYASLRRIGRAEAYSDSRIKRDIQGLGATHVFCGSRSGCDYDLLAGFSELDVLYWRPPVAIFQLRSPL